MREKQRDYILRIEAMLLPKIFVAKSRNSIIDLSTGQKLYNINKFADFRAKIENI
ncbi:hypothetical protein NIES4101_71850 [Calothrix sp. NIES-4101]|nr:hypothetical protein NIES4101_71850 [Calothrix sp. NIES-4101]